MGMMNGDSRKFVNEVPYITSPGEKVSTIFTNTAVLTRENADESFVVSQWIPNDFQSDLHYKTAISDLLPWKIDVCKEAKVMDEPTEQELEWLRAFDPHREFFS
ncbi:hypothetical protein QS257_12025 [Terrilactibacillus sp. S3-3]|nr:hypothetical protein QS257_12025 [Terrilactibacillus sp. S3-3]